MNGDPSGGLTVGEMRALLGSWVIALRGSGMAGSTVSQYERSARFYLDWCEQEGLSPDLADPEAARLWLGSLLARGQSGGTGRGRLAGLRAWSQWLLAEGELPGGSAVDRVAWPRLDERVPDYLTEDQRDAIVHACAGPGFLNVRDAALFSMMFDGLVRADEAVSMLADGDARLATRVIRVRRGKGGKERFTTVSAPTAAKMERYQRARRRHRLASIDAYWISQKGSLTYRGLYATFKKRAAMAGIEAHPHMLRAGGAVQWRRDGGTTEGLMTIAGWTTIQMVMLYTRAAEIELAIAEAKRLHDRRR